MLQVYKFYKYELPLTHVLKHFAQVFNYLSQTLRIYMYIGIYKKKSLLLNLQYVCEKTVLKTQCHSTVIAPNKP